MGKVPIIQNRIAPLLMIFLMSSLFVYSVTCENLAVGVSSSVKGVATYPSSTPLLGTFYYPWYKGKNESYGIPNGEGAVWREGNHNPPRTWASNFLPDINPTKFDPGDELYDSNNSSIVKKQLQWMKDAGIQFAISSWFGSDAYTDRTFSNIINNVMPSIDNPFPSLKWTLLYEDEGNRNPPINTILHDLNYIKKNYASSPFYLKIDGKPVIFVFNAVHRGDDPLYDLSKWAQAREQSGFYVVMKDDPLKKGADPNLVDGWYEYHPGNRYDQLENYSATISPGYWKYNESPYLMRNVTDFEVAAQKLKASNVHFKLIETWNEWVEGTGIEPAQQIIHNDTTGFSPALPSYGSTYLDILGKYFGDR